MWCCKPPLSSSSSSSSYAYPSSSAPPPSLRCAVLLTHTRTAAPIPLCAVLYYFRHLGDLWPKTNLPNYGGNYSSPTQVRSVVRTSYEYGPVFKNH